MCRVFTGEARLLLLNQTKEGPSVYPYYIVFYYEMMINRSQKPVEHYSVSSGSFYEFFFLINCLLLPNNV